MPETADDSWLESGDEPAMVDKHGLSRYTGLTANQIDKQCDKGMPFHGAEKRGAARKFKVPEVVQWLLKQAGDTTEEIKRRSMSATAGKREHELAKLKGNALDVTEYRQIVADRIAYFQTELASVWRDCPNDGPLVERKIMDAINRLAEGVAA
jgi:hypothetical protein